MEPIQYEPHIHDDPSFPIIFHFDQIRNNRKFFPHWHESIEILFVTEGTISVLSDTTWLCATEGDIVVINSGNMHMIQTSDEIARYFCLIIDKSLCEDFGIFTEDIIFERVIRDKKLRNKYIRTKDELLNKKPLYKSAAKSASIDFLVHLYRNHTLSYSPLNGQQEKSKTEIIKKSIKYMQENYDKNISTSEISKTIGLSTAYFCRTFKEITGFTPILYLNYLRCYHAKKLFQLGNYTVTEAATLCGFDNLSYFSKTYKKHMGSLPSNFKKQNKL